MEISSVAKKPKGLVVSNLAPKPKVAAAAAVGTPLALVVAWVAGLLGVDMPAEVAAAVGGLVSSVVAYFKRD